VATFLGEATPRTKEIKMQNNPKPGQNPQQQNPQQNPQKQGGLSEERRPNMPNDPSRQGQQQPGQIPNQPPRKAGQQ
jgi:hypothetical protein